MDNNLFSKYQKQIDTNIIKKREIIEYIAKKTKILLEEKEIIVEKAKIKIITTSAKRMFLKNNKIESILKEIGYIASF